MSIPLIQELVKESGLDGWLFYDFHKCNPLMWEILEIPDDAHITRRSFYFIPKEGLPTRIISKIEPHVLDHLPGKEVYYSTFAELNDCLEVVKGRVAMEYSQTIPYISHVDGGVVDILRAKGIEIVSSGVLLQRLTSILSPEQIASHKEAAAVLDDAANAAFELIRSEMAIGNSVWEGDVQELILNKISSGGCITDHPPIVARGENSANPHYMLEGKGELIQKGHFVLIDLWCKKRAPGSIYADISRVACTKPPTEKEQRAFDAVREAQRKAVALLSKGGQIRGADVDTEARTYLEQLGYSDNIYHRTGHNIHTELHGMGACFDSFETFDDRILEPGMCFSVEPALYFPGEFGLRLEHDVLYLGDRVEITGGVQDALPVLA